MKKTDRLLNISVNDKSSESDGKLKQVDLRLYIKNNFQQCILLCLRLPVEYL